VFTKNIATYHKVVVAILQVQTVGRQDSLQQVGITANRGINNDRLALQLVNAGDGGNGRENQVRALVQLAQYRERIIRVKAQVERIVHSCSQDIILAIQNRLECGGTIRHLIIDHVQAIFGEEAELVSNRVGGGL
jgi:hypothetical protein